MSERALPVDIFVVAGPPGVGKSAFCDYAQEQGWGLHFQVSDLLRDMAAGDDRAALGEIADNMAAEHGPRIWCDLAVEYWLPWRREFSRVFVNGPRRVGEIAAALGMGADVGYIEADELVCADRMARRAQTAGQAFDRNSFLSRSEAERHGRTSGGEQGIFTNRIRTIPGVLRLANNVELPALGWLSRPRPPRSHFAL
jgi:hypothetical protein